MTMLLDLNAHTDETSLFMDMLCLRYTAEVKKQ